MSYWLSCSVDNDDNDTDNDNDNSSNITSSFLE